MASPNLNQLGPSFGEHLILAAAGQGGNLPGRPEEFYFDAHPLTNTLHAALQRHVPKLSTSTEFRAWLRKHLGFVKDGPPNVVGDARGDERFAQKLARQLPEIVEILENAEMRLNRGWQSVTYFRLYQVLSTVASWLREAEREHQTENFSNLAQILDEQMSAVQRAVDDSGRKLLFREHFEAPDNAFLGEFLDDSIRSVVRDFIGDCATPFDWRAQIRATSLLGGVRAHPSSSLSRTVVEYLPVGFWNQPSIEASLQITGDAILRWIENPRNNDGPTVLGFVNVLELCQKFAQHLPTASIQRLADAGSGYAQALLLALVDSSSDDDFEEAAQTAAEQAQGLRGTRVVRDFKDLARATPFPLRLTMADADEPRTGLSSDTLRLFRSDCIRKMGADSAEFAAWLDVRTASERSEESFAVTHLREFLPGDTEYLWEILVSEDPWEGIDEVCCSLTTWYSEADVGQLLRITYNNGRDLEELEALHQLLYENGYDETSAPDISAFTHIDDILDLLE